MGSVQQMWAYLAGWAEQVGSWVFGAQGKTIAALLFYLLLVALYFPITAALSGWTFLAFYLVWGVSLYSTWGWVYRAGYEWRHGKTMTEDQRERWMEIGAIQQRTRDLEARIQAMYAARD